MYEAEARADSATLDAIQVARGRVPIEEFRLLTDCTECMYLARLPATAQNNMEIRVHIRTAHGDLIEP